MVASYIVAIAVLRLTEARSPYIASNSHSEHQGQAMGVKKTMMETDRAGT